MVEFSMADKGMIWEASLAALTGLLANPLLREGNSEAFAFDAVSSGIDHVKVYKEAMLEIGASEK